MSDSQSSPSIRAPRAAGTKVESASKRTWLRIWLLIALALVALIILAAVASAPYWKPVLRPYLPWIASSTDGASTQNPAANSAGPDASPPAVAGSGSSSQTPGNASPPVSSAPENKAESPQPLAAEPENTGSASANPEATAAALQTLSDDQRKLAVAVSEMAARLDKLDAAIRRSGDQAHIDRVLILAAAQLQDALSRSAPYEPALAVLQALAKNDQQLTPLLNTLAPNAQTGVKSRAVLEQQLRLLEPVLAEPLAQTNTSWWQEAIDRAKRIVSVRHVADPAHPETSPEGPDRTLALAEVDLLKNDLGGAIQEMRGLHGDAAERAKHWLDQAQARWDAEQAAANIENILTQRLATPEEVAH